MNNYSINNTIEKIGFDIRKQMEKLDIAREDDDERRISICERRIVELRNYRTNKIGSLLR